MYVHCWGSYVRLLGVRVVVFGVVCHACFGNFNHIVVWYYSNGIKFYAGVVEL